MFSFFYGFGKAAERMNRRVRDTAFGSLVRQEVAYFDKHSVGSITTQLQEDATLIQSFSGQPIRVLSMTLASILIGLVISFAFMWYVKLLIFDSKLVCHFDLPSTSQNVTNANVNIFNFQ
mmetsp:Transcript_22456/g.33650  ORF Transcript_22456/g.33650 Transcript_22456/m.33650 type:complete len:120 (+) Transcript_22456:1016-1375(+)